MNEQGSLEQETIAAKAGTYLTFTLNEQQYGLEAVEVREIIGAMDITAVPRTPGFVRGVINLRGQVIPVVDLRSKFGMPPADDTSTTCIVVVYVGDIEMGVVVDEVCEVVRIAADELEETPSFGAHVDTDFIVGIGKVSGQVTILLNIEKALTSDERESLDEAREVSTA